MIKSTAAHKIELAPKVDITDLEFEKQMMELTKFETTNQVTTKHNHLTGVVEQININPAKFYEQYHNFENFGHALNPSDNADAQLQVYSNHVKNVDMDANVEGGTSISRKAYRK